MTTWLDLSTKELLAEVSRRQQGLPKLLKRRAKLQRQLTAIENRIRALSSADQQTGTRGGAWKTRTAPMKARWAPKFKRPRNSISLLSALLKVLHVDKSMGIPEIVAELKKIGYRSNARNFSVLVSQVLSKAGRKVVRVKRGEYALAGWVMSRSLLT